MLYPFIFAVFFFNCVLSSFRISCLLLRSESVYIAVSLWIVPLLLWFCICHVLFVSKFHCRIVEWVLLMWSIFVFWFASEIFECCRIWLILPLICKSCVNLSYIFLLHMTVCIPGNCTCSFVLLFYFLIINLLLVESEIHFTRVRKIAKCDY